MTVLDTPAQISAWQFVSGISQLSLEVKTGTNFYGSRGSVLKGLQARGWTSVTGRATKKAKVLALAELIATARDNGLDGPVTDLAQKTLTEALDANGWVLEVSPA